MPRASPTSARPASTSSVVQMMVPSVFMATYSACVAPTFRAIAMASSLACRPSSSRPSTINWPPRPASTCARSADGGSGGTSSTARSCIARASGWSVVSHRYRARRSCSMPASNGSDASSTSASATRPIAAAASGSPPRNASSAARRMISSRDVPTRSSASGTRSQTSSARSKCWRASANATRPSAALPASTHAIRARGASPASCQWYASSAAAAAPPGAPRSGAASSARAYDA